MVDPYTLKAIEFPLMLIAVLIAFELGSRLRFPAVSHVAAAALFLCLLFSGNLAVLAGGQSELFTLAVVPRSELVAHVTGFFAGAILVGYLCQAVSRLNFGTLVR